MNLLIACSISVYGQDGVQFSQIVKVLEFINPAYNFSKTNPNATAIYRNQWSGVEGAPKTIGFNLHYPMQYQNFGLGINAVNQTIGLRNTTNVGFNFDVGVPSSKSTYMSLGLQGGIKQAKYKINEAVSYSEDIIGDIQNYSVPYIGAGFMLFTKHLHTGASVYTVFYNNEHISFNQQLSLNIHASYYFNLNRNIGIKPVVLYKQNTLHVSAIDLGAYVLYKDITWLGASYRHNDAVSVLLDIKLSDHVRIGYSYDISLLKSKRQTGNTSEIRLEVNLKYRKKSEYYVHRESLVN